MSAPQFNPDATDIDRLHSAVKREKGDVPAGQEPAPMWLIFTAMLIAVVAGGQLGPMAGGFNFNTSNPFAVFKPVDPRPTAGGDAVALDPFQKAMKKGASVYALCGGCHQPTGGGLAGQFPPLAGSEWVHGGTERIIRIVLNGLKDQITVKGTPYNTPGGMPQQGALSDQDIANVVTYVRNSWGNEGPMVTKEMVTAVRKEAGARTTQWTEAELAPFADKNVPGEIPAGPGATAAPAAAPAAK